MLQVITAAAKMLPRANLNDLGSPLHVLMRHRTSQVQRSANRPRTDGPIIVISSPLQHLKQVFALSFRHYAAPWHAYLYISASQNIMTATVQVRPQTPVTANGAAKSTSLSTADFIATLPQFCLDQCSLSRPSLDDGRANVSQALCNALYFIFLGLPPFVKRPMCSIYASVPSILYDGTAHVLLGTSILHSHH